MSQGWPRLLDRDPFTGIEEWAHPTDEGIRIEYRCDMQDALDWAERLRNAEDRGWSKSRTFRRVATIPPIIELKWEHDHGIRAWDKNHQGGVRKLLNDPDWRKLRTAPGNL